MRDGVPKYCELSKSFRKGPDIPRAAGCVPVVSGQLMHTGRRVMLSGVTWWYGT